MLEECYNTFFIMLGVILN